MKEIFKNIDFAIKKYLLFCKHIEGKDSIKKSRNIFRIIERNYKEPFILYINKELFLESVCNSNLDKRYTLVKIEKIEDETIVKTIYYLTNNKKETITNKGNEVSVEYSTHDYTFLENHSYNIYSGMLDVLVLKNKELMRKNHASNVK